MYADHHGWLVAWLRKKVSSPERAADFAQDTFFRLLGLGGELSLREPRAFLTTTATRLIIDDARRRRLEQDYLDALGATRGDACAPSPESVMEAVQTLALIEHWLEGLGNRQREAFLMSRLQELSHAEIAATLGVSVSMVKQYLAKAMLHLYHQLYGPLPGSQAK